MSLYQLLYHSAPFQTTTGSDNPKPEGYPPTLRIEADMTIHLERECRPGEEAEP
jgi:hypothetical protein